MDNFPVAQRQTLETGQQWLTIGHDLGFIYTSDVSGECWSWTLGGMIDILTILQGKAYINNHFDFTISYHHNEETDLYRVVGAVVEPRR